MRSIFVILIMLFIPVLISCEAGSNDGRGIASDVPTVTEKVVTPTAVVIEPTVIESIDRPTATIEATHEEPTVTPAVVVEPGIVESVAPPASESDASDNRSMLIGAWYGIEEDGSLNNQIIVFGQDGRYVEVSDCIGTYQFLDDQTVEAVLPWCNDPAEHYTHTFTIESIDADSLEVEDSGWHGTFHRVKTHSGLKDKLVGWWQPTTSDELGLILANDGTLCIEGYGGTWEVWGDSVAIFDLGIPGEEPELYFYVEINGNQGKLGEDVDCLLDNDFCYDLIRHPIVSRNHLIGLWEANIEPGAFVEITEEHIWLPFSTRDPSMLSMVFSNIMFSLEFRNESGTQRCRMVDPLWYNLESTDKLILSQSLDSSLEDQVVFTRVK